MVSWCESNHNQGYVCFNSFSDARYFAVALSRGIGVVLDSIKLEEI